VFRCSQPQNGVTSEASVLLPLPPSQEAVGTCTTGVARTQRPDPKKPAQLLQAGLRGQADQTYTACNSFLNILAQLLRAHALVGRLTVQAAASSQTQALVAEQQIQTQLCPAGLKELVQQHRLHDGVPRSV
jgi:hypothetical protein